MKQIPHRTERTAKWGTLETCRWSVLHLCTKLPGSELSFWQDRAVPYLITVVAFLAIPLFVAAATLPTLTKQTEELVVPCLLDYNMLFMFGITLPLLIVLLLTERSLIPARIASVTSAGVLTADDERRLSLLAKRWERKYAVANAMAQLVGVGVAAAVSYMNYRAIIGDNLPVWSATSGRLNPAGWIYLAWQLPGFYFVACIYVVRGVTTVAFLNSVVRHSSVNLSPFHPDGAGGLKAIGRMGLRNQYVLAACGINILLMFYVAGGLSTDSRAGATLLIAASAFYVVAGPAMFIGPLLPFRKSMLASKQREQQIVAHKLREEYERVMSLLPQEGVTQTAVDSLKRLQEVQQIVKSNTGLAFRYDHPEEIPGRVCAAALARDYGAVTGEAGSICKPNHGSLTQEDRR